MVQYNKNIKNKKKGFTLVELMVVLAITAILAALVGGGLIAYTRLARFEKNEANARTLFQTAQISLTRMETAGELDAFRRQVMEEGSTGDHFQNDVTVTDADGNKTTSKTETTTDKSGTVTESKTETKTDADGTKTEVKSETKKDQNGVTTGTETVKETLPNGSTGTTTTTTDANGTKTEAVTTISSKAVDEAKKNDEAVTVPVDVKATEDSQTAPTVKVELPKNSGETKVEIPVSNVTPGTVVAVVKPDGTEEIVKDCIPTENGIQLAVEDNVTLKVFDNAKDFTDTKGHWAEPYIDFASARELLNGISEDTFAPEQPTTRAMMWTVLARQDDTDLSGGTTWYDKAQAWAKDSGVSDGTAPQANVTRAQMVTMLWRAAGSPAPQTMSSFADVSADAYYAAAVAWAAEQGITNGVSATQFQPNGACTRAQIAAFLYRASLEN